MSDRNRSIWAWGYEDRLPAPSAREAMAKHLEALLGFGGLAAQAPADFEQIVLPPPRLDVPEALAEVASGRVADRLRHTYGKAYPDIVRAFQGDFEHAPDWVIQARDEADVAAAISWASDSGVALIPYGGGTSVVGGVEARDMSEFAAVASLDMRRLDRVLEVDAVSRLARIQAGATGPRLESQLGEHGLTLRHYPQSFEFSTLGGWIATRAGGHFATVYTHIDDLVASVRMLTPDGIWESRRLPGSGAGPSPDRLVLGSEGILGVITEAWMRVQPRPRFRASASVTFRDWSAAVDAVREIAQARLFPANCRLLDKREAMLNRVTFDGTHVLVLGFESTDHRPAEGMARALEIATRPQRGGRCLEGAVFKERDDNQTQSRAKGAAAWRQAFLDGPYLQSALISMGVVVDTFETACTWQAFPALHAAIVENVRDAMHQATGQKGFISCRFTHVYPDGPAPYYTFIAPGRRGEELTQWRAIKAAASDTLMAHGATITHHHAVGRTHRPWYEQQRPAPFATALRAAKDALDPAGILNPGVLLGPES